MTGNAIDKNLNDDGCAQHRVISSHIDFSRQCNSSPKLGQVVGLAFANWREWDENDHMDTHNFHSALNEHRRIMMPVERLENASSHLNPGITQNLDSQTAKIEHHIESDQVAGAVR
ncbi:MAG: hypothetical protein KDE50_36670, partial [Caldilineaceae bacterium]|nr:hypothetical protein [Caldilineaceae bacterium]